MKKSIVLIFIVSLIFSCKTERKERLPNITGKAGEVVLIVNNEIWKSETKNLIDSIFKTPQIGLTQAEPILDLVRIPEQAFTDIFKYHRNLIFIKLNSSIVQSKIEIKKSVWANNQLVITIEATNIQKLNEILNNASQKITNAILEIEKERIIENYNLYKDEKLISLVRKKFDINLTIPKGYTVGIDSVNFVWLSYETPLISQGIFVYTYDYVDTNSFKKENLIAKRNEFLKKYVAGPSKNSYMSTEIEANLNMFEFNYNEKYFVKINGLWKLEGDFMGGPFVSYTTLNKAQNKIITVEGFVYAPKFEKRNYLRQVEAIASSLKNY